MQARAVRGNEAELSNAGHTLQRGTLYCVKGVLLRLQGVNVHTNPQGFRWEQSFQHLPRQLNDWWLKCHG